MVVRPGLQSVVLIMLGATTLPSLIWAKRKASVGSMISPQNTPGIALHASIEPVPVPQYSTSKVLVTEWVQGAHLSALPAEQGLRMTRMAVEACTASLVLTGFVHADPHEGNIMLGDDGRCAERSARARRRE